MDLIEHPIRIEYRHRVYFTRNLFDPGNPLLHDVLCEPGATPRSAVVTLDSGVAAANPGLADAVVRSFAVAGGVRLAEPPLVLPGGEAAKNSGAVVDQVQALIARQAICRHSYVIAVGGGAHLDVVGFAAATAHRGVRHVRVPTTTLAQADSGVGVKNGINAFGRKNFIGTFAPPHAVLNDFELLASLSPRDLRCGFAEAVKVALIRDGAFFAELEAEADALARFEPTRLERLIRRCAALHAAHIATAGDPFELGSARPLDFGHWAAHKLEQMTNYALRHGEAVAIGIALDTLYARRLGWLDATSAGRVLMLLERLGFTLFDPALETRDGHGRRVVLEGIEEFREHLGGRLTITLLQGLGRGVEAHELDAQRVAESIEELAARPTAAQRSPA